MAGPSPFVFHGGVFPFEARLDGGRPVHFMRGTVALPRVGGDFTEDDGPWVLPPIGSASPGTIRRVKRRVTGEGDARRSTTRVSCEIEGLVLPGLITAERLEAGLTSTFDGERHSFDEEVNVDGLRIDRNAYQVNEAVLGRVKGRSLAELRDTVRTDPALVPHLAGEGAAEPAAAASGNLACFLVQPHEPLRLSKGSTELDVVVGEYSIGDRQRRLTMLRIEMKPVARAAAGTDAAYQRGSVVFMELLVNGHRPP
jgi:hypothetical protein